MGFTFAILLIFSHAIQIYQNISVRYLGGGYTPKYSIIIVFYNFRYLSNKQYFPKISHFYNIRYLSNGKGIGFRELVDIVNPKDYRYYHGLIPRVVIRNFK
jgi:hypothetical protein